MPFEYLTPKERVHRLRLLQTGVSSAAEAAVSPFEVWPEVSDLINLHKEQLKTPNPTKLLEEQWKRTAHTALQAFGKTILCANLIAEARNRLSNPGDTSTPFDEYRREVIGNLTGFLFETIGILFAAALEIDNGNNIRVITDTHLKNIYRNLHPKHLFVNNFFSLGSLLGISTGDAFFAQPSQNDTWKVTNVIDPSLHEGSDWSLLYSAVRNLESDYPSVFGGATCTAVVTKDHQIPNRRLANGFVRVVTLPFSTDTFTNFYKRFYTACGISMHFGLRRDNA